VTTGEQAALRKHNNNMRESSAESAQKSHKQQQAKKQCWMRKRQNACLRRDPHLTARSTFGILMRSRK